jgi:hypothetical protein
MKICISLESDPTASTVTLSLVNQSIRLVWQESGTGEINWHLEIYFFRHSIQANESINHSSVIWIRSRLYDRG